MSALQVFIACAKSGALGFGGGPSVIPLLERECVQAGLIDSGLFLEGLAAANALPGPIATKMSIFVGYHHAGYVGAVVGLVGMLLPSTLLMGLLTGALLSYREHPRVAAALAGVKPAVVGMLAWTAVDLASKGIVNGPGAGIALVAFIALVSGLHPAWVMFAAAIVGVALFA